MRLPLFVAAALFALLSVPLHAAKEAPGGMLSAIKLLPRGEAKRIARIEAREGTPVPERWHIVVHDPKDESGVHEYVIAGGEIVASRNLSQFAENLQDSDVIGSSGLKVDSDRLATLAQRYAQANNASLAAINYALKKEGADAAPLWSLTCLDETGQQIGLLVVSASKGTVVSRQGFTAEPTPEPVERPTTQSSSNVARVITPLPAATPQEKKGFFNRLFNGKQQPQPPQQPAPPAPPAPR